MRIYTSRPRARRAREVWDLMTARRGREPLALWYNSPAWSHWGDTAYRNTWVAQFEGDPIAGVGNPQDFEYLVATQEKSE